MKCPKCGGEHFSLMTTMIVQMPFEYFHNLTKKEMHSKDFKVLGVDWSKADFICRDCGHTIIHSEENASYPQYVSSELMQNLSDFIDENYSDI